MMPLSYFFGCMCILCRLLHVYHFRKILGKNFLKWGSCKTPAIHLMVLLLVRSQPRSCFFTCPFCRMRIYGMLCMSQGFSLSIVQPTQLDTMLSQLLFLIFLSSVVNRHQDYVPLEYSVHHVRLEPPFEGENLRCAVSALGANALSQSLCAQRAKVPGRSLCFQRAEAANRSLYARLGQLHVIHPHMPSHHSDHSLPCQIQCIGTQPSSFWWEQFFSYEYPLKTTLSTSFLPSSFDLLPSISLLHSLHHPPIPLTVFSKLPQVLRVEGFGHKRPPSLH